MKKAIAFLIIVLLLLLTSCDPANDYEGVHSDLFTQAVHSILNEDGIGFKGSYPRVQLIEEDNFGRKMFIYYLEVSYESEELPYALLISQKSDEQYVYYYPDFSFILTKYYPSTVVEPIYRFSEMEIDKLKKANDWNKELALDKCIKREICSEKEYIYSTKELEDNFETIFWDFVNKKGYHIVDSQLFEYATFCTSDLQGKKLYFVSGDGNEIDYGYIKFNFAVIVNKDDSIDISRCYMEITDMLNYQEELKEFKELNNWQDFE